MMLEEWVMTSKQEQQQALQRRLQDGWAKIGEAMEHGIEVDNWERHFADLLKQYEVLSDELDAAKPEQVGMAGMPRAEAA